MVIEESGSVADPILVLAVARLASLFILHILYVLTVATIRQKLFILPAPAPVKQARPGQRDRVSYAGHHSNNLNSPAFITDRFHNSCSPSLAGGLGGTDPACPADLLHRPYLRASGRDSPPLVRDIFRRLRWLLTPHEQVLFATGFTCTFHKTKSYTTVLGASLDIFRQVLVLFP
jgi:hypothetical protein